MDPDDTSREWYVRRLYCRWLLRAHEFPPYHCVFQFAVLRLFIMSACPIVERLDIEWRVEVSDFVRRSIESLYASQKTLEDVVRWGLGLKPPQMVQDVVIQDEYTHDVVIGHPSGVWLVYDAT